MCWGKWFIHLPMPAALMQTLGMATRTAAAVCLVLATGILVACSAGYGGPGTDHPFVGRSLSEVEPCADPGCGVGGINLGTLDGTVVRVTKDLSADETFSDLACSINGDRLNLVTDGDTIVAATVEQCGR